MFLKSALKPVLKPLLSACSLCVVALAVACGSDVAFEVKDPGAACEGLEATCSTDGTSVLVCEGDAMVVDDACADGCIGAASSWFSTAVGFACCDNGTDRECINIHDSTSRDAFQFEEDAESPAAE